MAENSNSNNYLTWATRTLTPEELDSASPDSISTIEQLYDQGYVFTRLGRGVMHQTRSVRIRLSDFEPTSENRRILKRTDSLLQTSPSLAKIPDDTAVDYDWHIHKIGYHFYEKKFGKGIFSANKIKAILTDRQASSFNYLLRFADGCFCISYLSRQSSGILHYSYPFYDLSIDHEASKDVGLGMMIRAIIWAKEQGLNYIYLGSLQRPGDTYKLQFRGLEWFDGKRWQTSIDDVKDLLVK